MAEVAIQPGWLSLLPPVLAIVMALVTRQIIPSLLLGVWIGAWLVHGLTLQGAWMGLLDSVQVYVVEALSDPDHVAIVVFSLMIGGMVGIITRNGGTYGIVRAVTRWCDTPWRGQATTGVLGLAIFFDDYANTLVVGNTMRPVTDRLSISREKLAYIVDSTAAPVATIALVTTWIGFQAGLLAEAAGRIGLEQSGYALFLNALPYSFYPVLAITLVFVIALSGRDFGPMLAAERRARQEGRVLRPGSSLDEKAEEELEPVDGKPHRIANAIVPILVLVGATAVGLYVTGEGDTLMQIVGEGDAFAALLWGSFLSVLVAVALSVGQRILGLGACLDAWFTGVKIVLYVVIILTLAWSLSAVADVLGTGEYLAAVLGEAIPPALVPALLFLVAAAVAFATGTSWGTMGILTPLAIPLTWTILEGQGMASPDGHPILFAAAATILAGAVMGDHCSPISDTTVISSLASGCDVIDHVRTQLPYALLAGGVALVVGLLPVGFGLPWWVAMPAAIAATIGFMRVVGRRIEEPAEAPAAAGGEGRERV